MISQFAMASAAGRQCASAALQKRRGLRTEIARLRNVMLFPDQYSRRWSTSSSTSRRAIVRCAAGRSAAAAGCLAMRRVGIVSANDRTPYRAFALVSLQPGPEQARLGSKRRDERADCPYLDARVRRRPADQGHLGCRSRPGRGHVSDENDLSDENDPRVRRRGRE